jgi:phenylalanyl-tRNA synthetase alpha chain
MAEILNKVDQPITDLNVSSAEEIDGLFGELKDAFDEELGEKIEPKLLEDIRIHWLGRSEKSVRRRVAANWLNVKSPFRREVGQWFQKLLADDGHVARSLAEHRANWDAVPAIAQGEDQSVLYSTPRTYAHLETGTTEPVVVPEWERPGVIRPIGSRHLVRQTFEDIERIFLSLGFTVVEGNEIETPYYNFEALNIPEHHPARDTMDTFYLDLPPGSQPHLLRTHTSPMQVHTMEKQKPPVRIIVPGKVYRRDNPDATHSYVFHQVEGLAVDTNITFCEFKGTVEHFVREFLGPAIKTRLRPSYFPFTEPSVEVDATCFVCMGRGCRLCKFSGWIELFGAGMVDPAVYGFVNYDATRVSGYAFGMGVDRLSQIKYGIDDVQLFFQNDVRFLRQFA